MPDYAPARTKNQKKKNAPATFAEILPLPAMANTAPNQAAIPIRAGNKTFAEPADSLAEYADFGKKTGGARPHSGKRFPVR